MAWGLLTSSHAEPQPWGLSFIVTGDWVEDFGGASVPKSKHYSPLSLHLIFILALLPLFVFFLDFSLNLLLN